MTQIDIEAASSFLQRARELLVGEVTHTPEAAEVFLEKARRVVRAEVTTVMGRVARLIRRFDKLPSRVNAFQIAGIASDETVHTQVLGWLLNPKAEHGWGAAFLRRFLSRLSIPEARRLALSHTSIRVKVATECALDAGFVDIVLFLPGCIVSIECKVDDSEHDVTWRDQDLLQTVSYRRQLEDPGVRSRVLQRADVIDIAPWVVHTAFVRPSGREVAADDRATNLSWMDVDADLAAILRSYSLDEDIVRFIQAFRSVLLTRTGSNTPLVERLNRLRLLVDATRLHEVDPLRLYLMAQAVEEELQEESNG